MKIAIRNFKWTFVSGIVALVAGAPAWADDTELLLVNPNLAAKPQPNIMFILDTSGSMKSEEATIEPYDSSKSYTGNCDITKLYWTDINIEPVCDPAGNNPQAIQKSAFMCDAASTQINGIGSYTDTMIQRRDYEYYYSYTRYALVWLDLGALLHHRVPLCARISPLRDSVAHSPRPEESSSPCAAES